MNKVYIILVNYNTANHTIECIKSINQTFYKNYSIVVVDNASTDDSVCVLKQCGFAFKFIISNENLGFAGANNLGIKYALNQEDCDFVWLLNNDTVIENDCLDRIVKYYLENADKRIGIVSGKILYYSDKNVIWYAGGQLNDFKGDADIRGFNISNSKFESDYLQTFASGCCMLIPRKVVEHIQLPEKYFLYYEDVDYCKKIIEAGYRIAFVDDAIIYHKVSMATNAKSFSYAYYFTRNRLIYIRDNVHGIKKICSLVYTLLWLQLKVLKNTYDRQAVKKGKKDYLNRITGKIERLS